VETQATQPENLPGARVGRRRPELAQRNRQQIETNNDNNATEKMMVRSKNKLETNQINIEENAFFEYLYGMGLDFDEATITFKELTRVKGSVNHKHYNTLYNVPLNVKDKIEDVIRNSLLKILAFEGGAIHINLALGKLLFSRVEKASKWFHPSMHGTGALFDIAQLVRNTADIQSIVNKIEKMDLEADLKQNRLNSSYRGVFITNIEFYYTPSLLMHKKDLVRRIAGRCKHNMLPRWRKNDKTMISSCNLKKNIKDGHCVFWALAMHFLQIKNRADAISKFAEIQNKKSKLLKRFLRFKTHMVNNEKENINPRAKTNVNKYKDVNSTVDIGINSIDIMMLEQCLEINICLVEKSETRHGALVVQDSCYRHGGKNTVYLDVYDRHASLVLDIEKYSDVFSCIQCNYSTTKLWNLKRHAKNRTGCYKQTVHKFPGNFYKRKQTIQEKLAAFGLLEPDMYHPYIITYDFESHMSYMVDVKHVNKKIENEVKKSQLTPSLRVLATHKVMSVSICSNVEGHTEPVFLVKESDTLKGEKKLISTMLLHMNVIQEKAETLLSEKYEHCLNHLKELEKQITERIEVEQIERQKHVFTTDLLKKVEREITKTKTEQQKQKKVQTEKQTPEKKNKISYYLCVQLDRVSQTITDLQNWIREIPVFGFNSSGYDLKLIRHLLPAVYKKEEHTEESKPRELKVISGVSGYSMISTGKLKFLDIKSYLAPGTSLKSFLKQSCVGAQKGIFPYDYIDCLDKLEETCLPPISKWYSQLTNSNLLGNTEKQQKKRLKQLKDIWKKNNMNTMRCYLEYYNNLDVVPLVAAICKFQKSCNDKQVDPFKDAISSPGVSMLIGMKMAESEGYRFPLINDKNKDFQYKILSNIVGGPSIVFNQINESGVTKIRGGDHIMEKAVGYDANSMYPKCLQDWLPVNAWYRRTEVNNFKAERMDGFNQSNLEMEVLTYSNHKRVQGGLPPILTKHSNGGHEIYIHNYRVDGISEPQTKLEDMSEFDRHLAEINSDLDELTQTTVFEVNGCYYHGHEHLIQETFEKWQTLKATETDEEGTHKLLKKLCFLFDRNFDTCRKARVLKNAGYYVHTTWECQWREQIKTLNLNSIPDARDFKPYLVRKYNNKDVNAAVIIDELKYGKFDEKTGEGFFGFVRCDIKVPDVDMNNKKWDELAPIFVNAEITEKDLTDFQKKRLDPKDWESIKVIKRTLIDCLDLKGGLFTTPILRWYLQKGLEITHVYEVFETIAGRPFKNYMDEIVQARIGKDKAQSQIKILRNELHQKVSQIKHTKDGHDKKEKIRDMYCIKKKIVSLNDDVLLGDRAKINMNAFYGKMLENKTKQTNTSFQTGYFTSCVIAARPGHRCHFLIDEESETYELKRCKKTINFNIPNYIGLFVLQRAKVIMLEFVYDFLYKHCDPMKIHAIEMDTDSFYIAMAGETLSDCLRSYDVEDLQSFRDDCKKFLVSPDKHNLRTPGLFKVEWSGTRMYALTSKTYCGEDSSGGIKFSAKGVQNKINMNVLTADNYAKVCKTGQSQTVRQSGFKMTGAHHVEKGQHCVFGDCQLMSTYKGTKVGLNVNTMLKRKMFEGGSTIPHKRSFTVLELNRDNL
jgi:hypothetical protein